jgi:hypothetical protein
MTTIFDEFASFFEERAGALSAVALQGFHTFGRGIVLLHFHELERAQNWPRARVPVRFQPDMTECRDARLLSAVRTYDPEVEMLIVVGWVRGEQGGRYDVCRMRLGALPPRSRAEVA